MTDTPKVDIPKGNFIAFANREKSSGDDRLPIFINGRISKPGQKDERTVTVWAFQYADADGVARIGYNGTIGNVPLDQDAVEQIRYLLGTRPVSEIMKAANGIDVAPNHFVLFESKEREVWEATRDDDGKDVGPAHHYGWANFGDGSPLAKVGSWLGKDRYQHPMISGNTQYELTPEQRVALGYTAEPQRRSVVAEPALRADDANDRDERSV